MKIIMILSLALVGCNTVPMHPDEMCIISEKRLVGGDFVEIYTVDRRCRD